MIHRTLGLIALALLVPLAGLSAQEASSGAPPVLDVTGTEYEFRTPATEIPAGWNTLDFENRGEEAHEMVLGRVPEEGTYRELRLFLGAMDTLRTRLDEGAIDSATYRKALKRHSPGWIADLEAVGIIPVSPGRRVRMTVNLEPGVYQAICFLPDSAGKEHWRRGMRTRIDVTGDSTGARPPEADASVTVAGTEFEAVGQPDRGTQTLAVRFAEPDSSGEESAPGIQLARLEEGASVEDVWNSESLAGAPADYLGGTPGMPYGSTVYLTVDLEPGLYAWLGPEEEEMSTTFVVP